MYNSFNKNNNLHNCNYIDYSKVLGQFLNKLIPRIQSSKMH